jgi:hypothetical protein
MAIPQWDYLLSAAVSHDLVTVKETSSPNRIGFVNSENKGFLPFFCQTWPPLALECYALLLVQRPSHMPNGHAPAKQGVAIFSLSSTVRAQPMGLCTTSPQAALLQAAAGVRRTLTRPGTMPTSIDPAAVALRPLKL